MRAVLSSRLFARACAGVVIGLAVVLADRMVGFGS